MFQKTLDISRKPVYNATVSHPSITNSSYLDKFFRDNNDWAIQIPVTITLDNNACGSANCDSSIYVFESNAYFPGEYSI